MNEELMNFVNWLPEHVELFKGLTTEETVSKINKLSASEEGKETLEQLTKQYKNTEMGIFKEGGKLQQLLCFKTGGKGPDCGCNKVTKHQQTSKLPKYKGDANWGYYQGPEHDLGDRGKIYEMGYTQQTPGDTVGGDRSGYRFNWGDNQSVYVSDNGDGRYVKYHNGQDAYGQEYGRKDLGTNPKPLSEIPIDIQRQIEYADSVVRKNAPLITKHQETSILPKNKVQWRVDGPGRVTKEILENGTEVVSLTRPGKEHSVWYTEQWVTPDKADTLYRAWNTATPEIDRLNSRVYVTPTAYKNMSKFRQRFNKVVPEHWEFAFRANGFKNGGKIK